MLVRLLAGLKLGCGGQPRLLAGDLLPRAHLPSSSAVVCVLSISKPTMAAAVAMRAGSSDSGGFDKVPAMDSGKYVRYTPEQVEVLERLYIDCPKPSSSRRQQLQPVCPILANMEPKQIKVWFQNRRCRDKQRKESSRLQAVNRKLTAMNKLLMEENELLQKQVS